MKEYNFNKLNEITTPDSWIEKALAIPEAEEKRKPAIAARRIRYMALAASFVLVGALAVILFTNRVTEPPVIAKPTTVQSATEATAPTAVSPTAATSPTEKPTAKATQAPSAPTQSAEQSPTASHNASIHPAVKPTAAPTAAPTQPATAKPTPAPTQPPTSTPIAPTEPPTAAPAEHLPDKPVDLAAVGYDGVIIEKISVDDIVADGAVYCRIRTRDGEVLGDGDPYSEEHLARRIDRDGTVTVYYVPSDCVALPYAGDYVFEFYDETGTILYSGSEYLMPGY